MFIAWSKKGFILVPLKLLVVILGIAEEKSVVNEYDCVFVVDIFLDVDNLEQNKNEVI